MIEYGGVIYKCRRLILLSVLIYIGSVSADSLPLHQLNLPAGFRIAVFAKVENPRQLAISQSGVIFAGSRKAGKVHGLIDQDGDAYAETVLVLAEDLTMPSGLAIRGNDLYIAALSDILKISNIDQRLNQLKNPEIIYRGFPNKRHHGWKFIDFGPDGLLYVPVGAPCNICLSDNPVFASIQTLDVTAQPMIPQTFASGVRNSVGFTWHPETGHLWFTDNGRDLLGDERPPCELNEASQRGQHFGYPFIHGSSIADPKFGKKLGKLQTTAPILELGPHVAPLGIAFYEGDQFPTDYRQQLFIAEHGSWNRSTSVGHTGYRISIARQTSRGLEYDTFIDGWLQDNKAWGRPADILELADGSLLISDDKANVIYRVSYSGDDIHNGPPG
ncbi:MAG: sorbosone dehydrogenase [Gammaproteobacteria bacterium]|jgi:glucose/arabinose dehydrogenase|nr:sorbosone dehydrogenase [Gammaproteobacteria bacterium]